MSEEEERLVAEIPANLKDLVDADQRSNKNVVISALWQEFGGERKAVLERRIEEKERRISMVKSEKNERVRELEEHREELANLRDKREEVETLTEKKVSEAIEDAVTALTPAEWFSTIPVEEQLPSVADVEPYCDGVDIRPSEMQSRVVEEIIEREELDVTL